MPDDTTMIPSAEATEARIHLAKFLCADQRHARLEAWLELVEWTRRRGGLVFLQTGDDGRLTRTASRRLRRVLDILETDPGQRTRFLQALADLLTGAQAVGLVAESGLPGGQGFLAEAGDRIAARLLPAPYDHGDLSQILRRLFPGDAQVERLQRWDETLIRRVIDQLAPAAGPAIWAGVRRDAIDGFRLLAVRVQGLGLCRAVRERSTDGPLDASPFPALASASEAMAAAWRAGGPGPRDAWLAARDRCLAELEEIHRQVQDEGIGIEVVYGVAVIRLCLERMTLLVDVLDRTGREHHLALHALVAHLAGASRDDRSLRHLAGLSLRLLHRRIVERSGETGDHYIAQDRRAYGQLWLAALGGGLLTTGTAALKAALTAIHVSAFAHGLLYSLNYAASFLALQHFHLVLATKQPAMTAATLAGALRDHQGPDRLDTLEDFTVRIVHSQVAAAAGNIIAVAVGSTLLDLLWHAGTGRHILDAEQAAGIYRSFSPLDSGTVVFAAFTGVLLWLASLAGGWIDNQARLHRLPLALRDRGRPRLAGAIEHHLAGWGTNISLGMLLGFTPVVGEFFGLPLDVRHVTLSTGMLSLAVAGHADWWDAGLLVRGISGIGVMFVLNLGVSFGLSLATALPAYGLPGDDVRGLLSRLGRHLVRRPWDFVIPTRPRVPRSQRG